MLFYNVYYMLVSSDLQVSITSPSFVPLNLLHVVSEVVLSGSVYCCFTRTTLFTTLFTTIK